MNSGVLFCIFVHFHLPPSVHGASGSRAPAQRFPMNSRVLFCIFVHFHLPPPVHGASGSRAPAQRLPKIERGPIMATKPYLIFLIIHRRGDSDGQIAPFLEAHSPPAVPCHRPLVVMSSRARSDRRRGRSLCQLVGSEKQCQSCFFSLSSSLTRGLSHTARGVRGIITPSW